MNLAPFRTFVGGSGGEPIGDKAVFATQQNCTRSFDVYLVDTGEGLDFQVPRKPAGRVARRLEQKGVGVRGKTLIALVALTGGANIRRKVFDRALAHEIGLVPSTTPIESLQSNGMAEAFVKTLKHDYARVNTRPDAASVLRQPDGWFEHYNTVHPHKALGYRSPREFRKQLVKEATENAVGAGRRPHDSPMSAEALGSRPSAAQSAVARSASFDEGAAVDQS